MKNILSHLTAILIIAFCSTPNSLAQNNLQILENSNTQIIIRFTGDDILAFNGIPLLNPRKDNYGWGEDLVYGMNANTTDTRTMGAIGGIPLVDFWNNMGGVAIFNTTTYQEPFKVQIMNYLDPRVRGIKTTLTEKCVFFYTQLLFLDFLNIS